MASQIDQAPGDDVAGGAGAEPALRLKVEAAGRLDRALADAVPAASRSRLQQLIRAGAVRIDGAVVVDPARKVRPGEAVALAFAEPELAEPAGEDIPLCVIYEDRDVIVVDKPPGLVVHPAPGHTTGTLVNALIAHCGESLSGIGGVKRPGIVHRLDKDTSGLIVAVKNDRAHRALAAQFADHGRSGSLERAYVAIIWGALPRPRMTIDAPIERSSHNREKMTVVPRGRGRAAVTHLTVEATWRTGQEPVASMLRCRLETGRTHQIRVHLASIGHPLLGDTLYGSGFRTKAALLTDRQRAALEELGRQALHAAVLGFAHPITGAALRFESPLPADVAKLVLALAEAARPDVR